MGASDQVNVIQSTGEAVESAAIRLAINLGNTTFTVLAQQSTTGGQTLFSGTLADQEHASLTVDGTGAGQLAYTLILSEGSPPTTASEPVNCTPGS